MNMFLFGIINSTGNPKEADQGIKRGIFRVGLEVDIKVNNKIL